MENWICTHTKASSAEIITVSHEIWSTAFPLELADGQLLLSNVPGSILRETLVVFEEVIAIVKNPKAMVKKHGASTISLKIVFEDDEIKRFGEWLEERGDHINRIRKSAGSTSFWNIAAAFMLGFWIADD